MTTQILHNVRILLLVAVAAVALVLSLGACSAVDLGGDTVLAAEASVDAAQEICRARRHDGAAADAALRGRGRGGGGESQAQGTPQQPPGGFNQSHGVRDQRSTILCGRERRGCGVLPRIRHGKEAGGTLARPGFAQPFTGY